MIEFYYWPTPNGWKVGIMLEECGLEYELHMVNIGEGDQFRPAFLRISPNNKIPAIVDRGAPDGPLSIFESGAILTYLAEKSGRFMSGDARGRIEVMQWLYWQVGGLGPMAGQLGHFRNYAEEKIEYPVQRYAAEYNRLLGVLNRRLEDRPFIAGDYSIADMAAWPWVHSHEGLGQPLDEFPNVARWCETIGMRPAVQRVRELGKEVFDSRRKPDHSSRTKLFGQTAKDVDEWSRASGDNDN